MAALVEPFDLRVSVLVAEAMAIRRGIQFAVELGFSSVGIESDSSSLISLIINKDPPLSDVGLVVSDIIQLVSSLSISFINFVPRSCNGVAHAITRFGLSIPDFFWFGLRIIPLVRRI
ncbi:hypothetical protein ACOSP7_028547 [Xanthoceras sorbifolium]